MAMKTLIATKPMSYNTRRLLPGQEFEVKSERDARVLVAIRKAKEKRPEAVIPPPPAPLAAKIAETFAPGPDAIADDLKAARAEYEAAVGKRPFNGWSVDQLRAKIEEAKESTAN